MEYNRSFANEGTQLSNCIRAIQVTGDEMRLVGKWLNEGLSESEYNTLSNKAKDVPYKLQITLEEFRAYQVDVYEQRISAVIGKKKDAKGRASNGNFHNINLNTDFIDG